MSDFHAYDLEHWKMDVTVSYRSAGPGTFVRRCVQLQAELKLCGTMEDMDVVIHVNGQS